MSTIPPTAAAPDDGPITAPTPWTRASLVALAVVALAVACLAPVGRNGFVRWDDDQTIQFNPLLNPPTGQTLAHVWTHEHMDLWVPVTQTAWWALAHASAALAPDPYAPLNPALFHGASLAVHALTAAVIFLLLRRLGAPDVAAAVGAALFAVHPVQVEAVAWASGLKDVLCGLMTWAAVWQYVVAVQVGEDAPDDPRQRRRRRTHLTLAGVAFALALLSKPTAMVAPALALAIDVLVLRRSWRHALALLWPAFALSLACAVWTKLLQPAANTAHVPIYLRPLVAADALAFYLCKLAWPAQHAVDYGRHPANVIARGWIAYTWLLPLAVALAVGLLARHRRLLTAGAVVFVIGVAPVLGLVAFDFQGLSTVTDHYLYLSMAGAAMAAAEVARRLKPAHAIACAAPVLFVLGVLSWGQAGVWKDSVTLFEQTVAVNPASHAGRNNLASAYLDRREPAQAEVHARAALRIKPDYARAMVTLGAALAAQRRDDEAAGAYRDAIAAQPNSARAHANLGALLSRAGRSDEAALHLRRAIELNPQDGLAHLGLGLLLSPTEPERAMQHFRQSIRLRPRDARVRTKYGRALLARGRAREALAEFELAMKLDGDALDALYGADDAREMLKQPSRVTDAGR